MKVKLDENLPSRLRQLLEEHGHDVETVLDEGIGGADDDAVAVRATQETRMLLTLDVEFGDITRHPPGTHPGVVVIRVPEQRPSLITAALTALLARHSLDELSGCSVIAQLGGVRIRRPSE